MTDWDRVEMLRSKGSSWEKIAIDEKVGFHPPKSTNPGRALKARYHQRASRIGAVRHQPVGAPARATRRGRNQGASLKRRAIGVAVGGAFVAVLVLGVFFLHPLPPAPPPAPGIYPGPAAAGTWAEFRYLSQSNTNNCWSMGDETAEVNWLDSLAGNDYLQGACCTPMDFPDYSNQTTDLRSYSSLSDVAPDPNNVPAHIAQADVAGENLDLTPGQQSTLATAATMTNDNGWCCCVCLWYYAHEGLAKTLIVNDGYDAQQVVAVINLEDCCGGPGQMTM